MEVAQLQQRRLSGRSPASSRVARQKHDSWPHELQSLPIARDSRGRSPLQQHVLSLQSPHSIVSHLATSKPSSPAAQLLESLTPAKNSAFSNTEKPLVQEKEMASHLARCLQASATKEELRVATSRDALQPVPGDSIVACEGSPIARTLSRAFPECNPTKYASPEAALSALEERQAHRALLPVESLMHGTVHRTYDLLLRLSNVHIVGELVQQRHRPDAEKPEDDEAECERFWVLSRDASLPLRDGEKEKTSFKTTVAMVLREGLGALHKVLAAFAFRNITVSKVESRPWRAQPLAASRVNGNTAHLYFQYVLFIDFETSTVSRAAQNALAQLQEHCSFLRLLGSYPCFHTITTSALLTPRPQPVCAQVRLPQVALSMQVGAA